MTRVPLAIAADHPAFAGHFPERPVVPGVVLLDESLRAIAAHRSSEAAARVDARIDTRVDARAAPRVASQPIDERCRIASTKFLSFVSPGEAVHLEFESSSTTGPYRLRVLVGDAPAERLAMIGSLSFTMSENDQSCMSENSQSSMSENGQSAGTA